jgi:N-acetylmuramoyl-L-alanine amidase
MSFKKNLATLALAGGILLSSAYNVNPFFVMYNEIKNVMIVPGHDGRKSSGGARGRAGKESEIVLRIASRLEKKLKADNIRVFVTRDSDCYERPLVSTIRRNFNNLKYYVYENPENKKFNNEVIEYNMILFGSAKHANENNFDLIMNLHMDKADVGGAEGFTVIYSEKNKRADESREISNYIRDSMIEGGFRPSSVYGKGFDGIVERDDILLLGNHRIPVNAASVLVECDYIDNLDFLKSKTLDKAAECIYNGLMRYNREKCGSKPD